MKKQRGEILVLVFPSREVSTHTDHIQSYLSFPKTHSAVLITFKPTP